MGYQDSRRTSNRPCLECGKPTRSIRQECAACQRRSLPKCADCGRRMERSRVTGLCVNCYAVEVAAVGERDGESPNVLRDGDWVRPKGSLTKKWVAA